MTWRNGKNFHRIKIHLIFLVHSLHARSPLIDSAWFRCCCDFHFGFFLSCEANRCAVCIYEKFISFIIELNNRPFASSAVWRESIAHRLQFADTHFKPLNCICIVRVSYLFSVFYERAKQYRINEMPFSARLSELKWFEELLLLLLLFSRTL